MDETFPTFPAQGAFMFETPAEPAEPVRLYVGASFAAMKPATDREVTACGLHGYTRGERAAACVRRIRESGRKVQMIFV